MPACRIVFRGEGVPDRIVEARLLEVPTVAISHGEFRLYADEEGRQLVAAFPEEEVFSISFGNPQQDPESSAFPIVNTP